jgi:hypothetical protein
MEGKRAAVHSRAKRQPNDRRKELNAEARRKAKGTK